MPRIFTSIILVLGLGGYLCTATLTDPFIRSVDVQNPPQCPFNVSASISQDASLVSLSYNTTDTAIVELSTDLTSNIRKCYLSFRFQYTTDIDGHQFRIPSVTVSGPVSVGKDVTAEINTAIVIDGSPYV